MDIDANTLNQIAFSLAEHYVCVYYVNINSGRYIVFSDRTPDEAKNDELPESGENFFADASKNAALFIHPDDVELMARTYDKKEMLAKLSRYDHYSVSFRALRNGKISHMRHVVILCKDKRHVVCCLEDIENEYREKEEQLKKLANAKLLARTDELTGVKNSTAFKEYVDRIDAQIASEEENLAFAVVMCDINDLKQTNDTKGHKSGDTEIKQTSKLICGTFQHSPVFRVGGDEFVVVLTGGDYIQRDLLMNVFRDVTDTNRRTGSGPDVAAGMAVYENGDKKFSDVFQRADHLMYENKKAVKSE
ncbi:MAG: GGDEF domain-containing protein [Clostridiales bacterium]|nr:GGDEF domain-containing protein [Clostridiales bacterium]